MARRIFSFFIIFILTFGVSVYLILSEGLDKIKSDNFNRQQLVQQSVASELATSYALLEALIRYKSEHYKQLHDQALLWVQQQGKDSDLSRLQAELSTKAGFPVDIYLIDDELVIRNTTFAADAGLDFKHPVFKDVRLFLDKAKSSGEVLISQPTMELVSQKFKLYSYSITPTGGYLELGLVDPELNRFFETFIQTSQLKDGVNVELFFESWGELLAPIGKPASNTLPTKQQEIDRQIQHLEHEYGYFQQVIASNKPLRVDDVIDGHEHTSYYSRLHTINTEIGLPMQLLAKISFDNSWVAAFEGRFVLFFAVLAALAVIFMVALMLLVKYRLVKPIVAMVNAMHERKAVDTKPWKRLGEMAYLATNYNDLLYRNQEQLCKLEELSIRDPLTGLYNRRYLDQIYLHEVARAERNGNIFGFAMIDVDYFKAYNDRYGHPQGDEALKRVAMLLLEYFRRPNDFVFRVGGEEFAVLVTDTNQESLLAQLEALRSAVVEAAIEHVGSKIGDVLTISVGVYTAAPFDRVLLPDAVDRADKALYRAKATGRNRVVEIPPINTKSASIG